MSESAEQRRAQLQHAARFLTPLDLRRRLHISRDQLTVVHGYLFGLSLVGRVRRYSGDYAEAYKRQLHGEPAQRREALAAYAGSAVARELALRHYLLYDTMLTARTDDAGNVPLADYRAVVNVGRKTVYDWEAADEIALVRGRDADGRPALYVPREEIDRITEWQVPEGMADIGQPDRP